MDFNDVDDRHILKDGEVVGTWDPVACEVRSINNEQLRGMYQSALHNGLGDLLGYEEYISFEFCNARQFEVVLRRAGFDLVAMQRASTAN